jgi:DNA helicase-2/ATP-dependent DNA helicase PcrA
MKLNDQQNLLIEEFERNVILLASAGTGKTDTLSKRIANIIKVGKAKESQILCITFTNKACKEMKERIEKIVGASAKDITVKTFHSFCFDIIKQEAKKRTDIFTDFSIFDEDDCKELIKQCNYYDFPVAALQRFIDIVKLNKAENNIYSNEISEDYKKAVIQVFEKSEDKLNQICSEKGNINYKFKEFLETKGHILVNSYNSLIHNNHGVTKQLN